MRPHTTKRPTPTSPKCPTCGKKGYTKKQKMANFERQIDQIMTPQVNKNPSFGDECKELIRITAQLEEFINGQTDPDILESADYKEYKKMADEHRERKAKIHRKYGYVITKKSTRKTTTVWSSIYNFIFRK